MFFRIITPLNHSLFLFGPRGTGKSTFLKNWLPKEKTRTFDLLNFELEQKIFQSPGYFGEQISSLPSEVEWVFVDEVQKAPFLLDEVHRQIELNKKRKFAMTGSSTRKLRRGKANLLAGRAYVYHLHPLTIQEMGDRFDLHQALRYGTLPELFSSMEDAERQIFLKTYAQTYLQEEIQMEGLVRNLTSFRRFLPLAARENGQVLSWSNFAQDVGVDAKTVQSYFEILEDTLVGFLLPAYRRSLRKRQKTHPKFYFFDPGLKRALAYELSLDLLPGTPEFGRAFEHFWILEIMRMNSYRNADYRFSYFATNDVEIDLVIERPGKPLLFVEFKSTDSVKGSDIRPLATLVADVKGSQGIVVSREPRARKVANVLVCPWADALKEIGLA